jgi:hypothetical protein
MPLKVKSKERFECSEMEWCLKHICGNRTNGLKSVMLSLKVEILQVQKHNPNTSREISTFKKGSMIMFLMLMMHQESQKLYLSMMEEMLWKWLKSIVREKD